MRIAHGIVAIASLTLVGCGGSQSSPVKRVFATSMAFSVTDVGSPANADVHCKAVADSATAAGLGSFAGANWKAWLSDSHTNAIDRLADVGPWYLVDGVTKVANNKAQLGLVPAQLAHSINKTERGNTPSYASSGPDGYEFYWTGTSPGGQVSAEGTCQDWTSKTVCTAVGSTGAANGDWTEALNGIYLCTLPGSTVVGAGCSDSWGLLCFEQ